MSLYQFSKSTPKVDPGFLHPAITLKININLVFRYSKRGTAIRKKWHSNIMKMFPDPLFLVENCSNSGGVGSGVGGRVSGTPRIKILPVTKYDTKIWGVRGGVSGVG